jgi:hypothetical protein
LIYTDDGSALLGTVLGLCALSLADGEWKDWEAATDPAPKHPAWKNSFQAQQTTAAFYLSEDTASGFFVGKPASGQSNGHFWTGYQYDQLTDTWTIAFDTDFGGEGGSTGHIWNHAYDRWKGDYYWGSNGGLNRWDYTNQQIIRYANPTESGQKAGYGFHPNLFGPGQAGLVIRALSRYWRFNIATEVYSQMTPFWGTSGGTPQVNNSNGADGIYFSSNDTICMGSGRDQYSPFDDSLQMHRIVGGSSFAQISASIHGGGLHNSGGAAGPSATSCKVVEHPGVADRLLQMATADNRVWYSDDFGDSWTLSAHTHPFGNLGDGAVWNPSVGQNQWTCGSYPLLGIVWGLYSLSGGGDSIVWRPPVNL